MKLRSIALAGLLGAGLLMTSGCTEDDVIDAIKDALHVNVVYAVNGIAGTTVTFSATDQTDVPVVYKSFTAFPLAGQSSYTVSYNGGSAATINSDGIHLYVATSCNANGYLQSSEDANRVQVVNLTTAPLVGSNIVVQTSQGTVSGSTSVNPCTVGSISDFNNIVIENDMNISLDGGTTYTSITGIDANYLAIANNVKFDIVVFEDNNISLVPMAGYDDLLNFAAQ